MKILNQRQFPEGMSIASIKKLTTKKLVEFCAKDMRPFEIVSGDGFKTIAQHLWSMGAICGDMDVSNVLSHPTTISRNVAGVKEARQAKLLPIIENAINNGECSATTDMWTEDHKKNHFLTMTAHYFDNKFNLKRAILFTPKFKAKKKSGINIRKELKRRFDMMGLDSKLLLKVQFVTDQGSNVVNALKYPYKRNNCRDHLLNTILRNTFDSEKVPLIITKTLIICKNIVRYFKQSGKSNELSKGVIQDCDTRWNYKLDMLVSVVEGQSEIEPLLSVNQRRKWNIDIDLANDLISFLQPFKDATKAMEGDKYPTANKILLWQVELSEHLNEDKFESIPMKKLVRIAKTIFNKKYTIDVTNKIACFLDPRYRSLAMLNNDERNEVYDEVKRLIEEEENLRDQIDVPTVLPAKVNRFSCFEGIKMDEFQLYLETAEYSEYLEDADNKMHLIECFWRDNKKKFPNLYTLARKRLHVPASSGSSERVFSDAGRTCESRRSNLKPEILDDLLFIRDQFSNE